MSHFGLGSAYLQARSAVGVMRARMNAILGSSRLTGRPIVESIGNSSEIRIPRGLNRLVDRLQQARANSVPIDAGGALLGLLMRYN